MSHFWAALHIVPVAELVSFLSKFIEVVEKSSDSESDPIDLASDFLEFVKQRARLLIEVGDDQYAFVHLTFQEYLTSSDIITISEKEGINGIWDRIKEYCTNPRWHDVIRLLIAGLKSNETQDAVISRILSEIDDSEPAKSILLGGVLLDGIEPAEDRTQRSSAICSILTLEQTTSTNLDRGVPRFVAGLKRTIPIDHLWKAKFRE